MLDSNVIVSALHRGGVPDHLSSLAQAPPFELYLSEHILGEVEDVLARPHIGWAPTRIQTLVDSIRNNPVVITPPRRVHVVTSNPPDNLVLDCAVDAAADRLVTGDRRHLLPLGTYQGTRIVTIRECLDEMLTMLAAVAPEHTRRPRTTDDTGFDLG